MSDDPTPPDLAERIVDELIRFGGFRIAPGVRVRYEQVVRACLAASPELPIPQEDLPEAAAKVLRENLWSLYETAEKQTDPVLAASPQPDERLNDYEEARKHALDGWPINPTDHLDIKCDDGRLAYAGLAADAPLWALVSSLVLTLAEVTNPDTQSLAASPQQEPRDLQTLMARLELAEWQHREVLARAEAAEIEVDRLRAQGSAWQPIETAPKDHTPMLLYRVPLVPWVGYWSDQGWSKPEGIVYGPTHWMPLPAAPPDTETK